MIAIVDYEMGNLRSVQKAFERVGHAATITSDRAVLADAEKIVLPGVGAFRDAISADYEGLGVVPGEVLRFKVPAAYKVPHMGWNQLSFSRRPPIFHGVEEGEHFYFVHSYYVAPRDQAVIATATDYAGQFCSSIWRDNLFAVQFHPEKSQAAGLRLLKNFAELS
jgi:glutamine amidotransferase